MPIRGLDERAAQEPLRADDGSLTGTGESAVPPCYSRQSRKRMEDSDPSGHGIGDQPQSRAPCCAADDGAVICLLTVRGKAAAPDLGGTRKAPAGVTRRGLSSGA